MPLMFVPFSMGVAPFLLRPYIHSFHRIEWRLIVSCAAASNGSNETYYVGSLKCPARKNCTQRCPSAARPMRVACRDVSSGATIRARAGIVR